MAKAPSFWFRTIQREMCDELARLPLECVDPGTAAVLAAARMAAAELLAQDFVLGEELGKGGFARVFRARERCRCGGCEAPECVAACGQLRPRCFCAFSADFRSGREVAVKEIPKRLIVERKLTAKVVNEVKIHWQLHHTHVVDLLVRATLACGAPLHLEALWWAKGADWGARGCWQNFFEDEEKIYLVLELCEKGDLYKLIHRNGPMDEQAARGIILQV